MDTPVAANMLSTYYVHQALFWALFMINTLNLHKHPMSGNYEDTYYFTKRCSNMP